MRKREKVEQILKENPYLRESEVARLAGCSTVYVYKIKQKPKEPFVRIQALVPLGFKRLLERFCEETNMSISEFIREAIQKQFYSKELLLEV